MLAEQVRSGLVETYHDGAVAVVGPTGELIASFGDIDRPFFFRSAGKPFQAAVSLACGAPLERERLAMACASHTGEPVHVALVGSILERAGLTEDDLGCPRAWPMRTAAMRRLVKAGAEAPRRIWHNCSGKHAAMLAACVASGWDRANYLQPDHPLQRRIIEFLNDLAGPTEPVGVDGCGAPVHRTTARGMALAFARLAVLPELTPVWAAMHAYPLLVAGPGRTDSAIAMALNVAAKGGALGSVGVSVRGQFGIAVKSWDGSDVVAAMSAVEALRQLGAVSIHAETQLRRVISPVVIGGDPEVGRFVSKLELRWS